MLVAYGAHVNEAVGTMTPLHIASTRGHAALVSWLVANGANPETRTETGTTAFDMACEHGHVEVLFFFLRHHNWLDGQLRHSQGR